MKESSLTKIEIRPFISQLNLLHCNAKNKDKALEKLTENNEKNKDKIDAVTYNITRCFQLINVEALQKDNDGLYFYAIDLNNDGDIVDDFKLETSPNMKAKLRYMIGGRIYSYEELNEFIIAAAPYSKLIILVTFIEPPLENARFSISMKYYILDKKFREKISYKSNCHASYIEAKNTHYVNGRCLEWPDFLK